MNVNVGCIQVAATVAACVQVGSLLGDATCASGAVQDAAAAAFGDDFPTLQGFTAPGTPAAAELLAGPGQSDTGGATAQTAATRPEQAGQQASLTAQPVKTVEAVVPETGAATQGATEPAPGGQGGGALQRAAQSASGATKGASDTVKGAAGAAGGTLG